ncbi:MAG: efflux RND transporter periplasmic adaptor subunit [Desulfobacteraceae bacterium]|jgi:Cu(I)/Ag(I) efflux system membrane fusion protein
MKKKIIIYAIIILAAFSLGFLFGRNGSDTTVPVATHNHEGLQTQSKIKYWTCSMHPQIHEARPGKCPICGMDLIPVYNEDTQNASGARDLKMSPLAMKLADIETSKVERKFVPADIRLVGKVDYDETKVKNITAWIPGRLDRLFVDYTGITVKKGDHMVLLYSPDLLTAQEELIQAKKSANEFKSSNMKIMRETAIKTLEASRDKLRLWGLTQGQIDTIEKSGKATDHITIYSPISGVVVKKNVDEGAYVKTGTKLYTVADLSSIWVMLDAYESDLVWLRYGQEVGIETEAYPGEIFKGTISFIDPILDAKTRTVKVRVNVPNNEGKLKPDMFVRSVIHSRVAQSGKIMDEALAGKWICPMHPEVIKDKKGNCDICGMPLVTTESLGYATVKDTGEDTAPLVIPASAPLITGKRAVVYVSKPDKEGEFEGREIILGPRVGDYYIVDQGLSEGEMVVTSGNFKIDSALQIQAKPSMMSPEGDVASAGHASHTGMEQMAGKELSGKSKESDKKNFEVPDEFKEQIDNVLGVYFKIQDALTKDDSNAAQKQGKSLKEALDNVNMELLKGDGYMASWMKELKVLNDQSSVLGSVSDIEKQRKSFELISESLKSVIKKFSTAGKHAVIVFHCPMAFDGKGADWLQDNPDLKNPYFGSAMLTCGDKKEILVTRR